MPTSTNIIQLKHRPRVSSVVVRHVRPSVLTKCKVTVPVPPGKSAYIMVGNQWETTIVPRAPTPLGELESAAVKVLTVIIDQANLNQRQVLTVTDLPTPTDTISDLSR